MQTQTQNYTIVGMFDRMSDAQSAIRELVDQGIDRDDISLIARNQDETPARTTDDSTHSLTTNAAGEAKRTVDGTSMGENVAAGTIVGGLGGLLIGLGALAIPGIGPIVAAGPIATTLAGLGFGALGGGIIGGLKDAGVPDGDAHAYAEGVRRGSILVSVRAHDQRAADITDIMERHNAIDVDERSTQWQQEGWTKFDEQAQPYTSLNLNTPPAGATMTTSAGTTRRRSVRIYDKTSGERLDYDLLNRRVSEDASLDRRRQFEVSMTDKDGV